MIVTTIVQETPKQKHPAFLRAPCDIGQRIAFVHAYNAGLTVQEFEPKSKASSEINALYSYIATEMGV